jgi:hypothetical protein
MNYPFNSFESANHLDVLLISCLSDSGFAHQKRTKPTRVWDTHRRLGERRFAVQGSRPAIFELDSGCRIERSLARC